MKKQYLLLTALLAFVFLPFIASAQYDFSAITSNGQTLYYRITSDNTVSVVKPGGEYQSYGSSWRGYTQPSGNLIIPSTVSHNNITYTVTYIGFCAFYGCSELTSIVIPNSVTSMASYAFSFCSGLTSINIPNTFTSISNNGFRGCSSLTSINIPNSVTLIDIYAFDLCYGLTSITIPNSVTTLEWGSFGNCTGLTSITIGSSVNHIVFNAFSGCSGVSSIIVDSSNITYDSRNNCNAIIHTSSNELVRGCQNTIITNSITSIGIEAFSGCRFVSMTIPNNITIIKDRAFSNCDNLESIVIPSSVDSIGEGAFSNDSNITTITSLAVLPPILGVDAFLNVHTTIPIYVPCGAEAAYRADTSWNHFTNIIGTCPRIIAQSSDSTMGTVTGGGSYGVGDTAILTAIPVCGNRFVQWNDGDTSNPRQIIVYDNDTFTAQFRYIPYPVAISSGDTLTFSIVDCNAHTAALCNPQTGGGINISGNLTVPSYVYINGDYYTVTTIGSCALWHCDSLTSVTLPNSITTIEQYAFGWDFNLTSITLPSSLTNIRYCAFMCCTGLQSITLPNNLTTIEYGAFAECNSLTSVHIPASVTYIENQIFARCRNLTTITVDTNNTVYDSRDNCNAIIETATNTLINACNNTTTIPASVTAIGNYAFSGCSNLSTLTVLATVPPSLGNSVFSSVPNNIRLIVPCGSEAAYRADSGWSYFTNIVCPTTPSILVTGLANDSLMGSVTGNGLYAEGDTATLTAVASCGYRFDRWNDSVTDNPRQVIVATDTTFTAFFVSDADTVFIHDTTTVRDTLMLHDTLLVHDTLTIHDTLLVHDTLTVYDTLILHDTVGTVLAYYTLTVSSAQQSGIAVGSGRFSDSTVVEIAAIPVEGNFFVQWSDGNTENPRHVTMTEDIT